MTRKDFELIAYTLRGATIIAPAHSYPGSAAGFMDGAQEQLRDAALSFADRLAQTNPRFDRARFLAACGVS